MESMMPDNPIERRLLAKAIQGRIPISGTFELLPLCNMHCKMCYVRLSRTEMEQQGTPLSAEQWLNIARQAAELGTLFILLTGGEPLLHPEFRTIYASLKQLGMHITLNTNATLLDEDTVAFLSRLPPRRINVTLYGASDETYQAVCGNPNGFTQTVRGIRLLLKHQLPVKINITLCSDSMHDFQQIMRLCSELQLPVEMPYYLFPPANRRRAGRTPPLSPEQAAHLRFLLAQRSFILQEKPDAFLDDCKRTLALIRPMPDQGDTPKGFWCAAGYSSFWINWKGVMTSCGMLDHPAVDITIHPFRQAWAALIEQNMQLTLCRTCYVCPYRDVCSPCAASMQTETGHFGGTPTYRCAIMNEYECILKDYIHQNKQPE